MILFISGNMSITSLRDRTFRIITERLEQGDVTQVIVGDSSGADTLIQAIVPADMLTVYHSQMGARNTVEGANTRMVMSRGRGKDFHTCKDTVMARECDEHIGIVKDMSNSGTMRNHREVLTYGKPSRIIING